MLNISSYSNLNLFGELKSSGQDYKNYDAIQILNPSILKIILKLDQLIPQFHLTIFSRK